jgi:hypothetical protein
MSHVDGVDDGVGYGVYGRSFRGGYGVSGYSDKRYSIGVFGSSIDGRGVVGISQGDYAMYGESRYSGVWPQLQFLSGLAIILYSIQEPLV